MTPDEIRELRCECGHRVEFHDYAGCMDPLCSCIEPLGAALASALTERLADAWDECAREAHSLGWLHDPALGDVLERNPYRRNTEASS